MSSDRNVSVSRTDRSVASPKIGAQFGGRDHTTVIHAVQRIKGLMQSDKQVFDEVATLTPKPEDNVKKYTGPPTQLPLAVDNCTVDPQGMWRKTVLLTWGYLACPQSTAPTTTTTSF